MRAMFEKMAPLAFAAAAMVAMVGAMFVAATAHAQNPEVFVVPRVAVAAEGDSASAAKLKAQREGRRRALGQLMRRLTDENDWPRLPGDELSAGDLERLETGFEIVSERASAARYRALITYRFNPDEVRGLLRAAGVAYSESQTRPALVIPVLETANGLYLWEEQNPWLAAWRARPFTNELTPMIAPLGDLEETSMLSAQEAVALDEEAMRAFADRYDVSQIILAHANLRQIDGEDRLRVRFVNAYDALTEQAGPATRGALDPERPVGARIGALLAEKSFAQESGAFPALAERAIEETIARHAEDWKRETLIDHTQTAAFKVSAYYRSLDEWSRIRSALTSTPLIEGVQVNALSRNGADIDLSAFGDPGKLATAMEARGVSLWTDDGVRWIVATMPTAQSLRRDGGDRRF